jgi:long-chain acyl-CoA synthetase
MEKPWIKFYDRHVPEHLDYPRMGLQQILDDAADHFPEKPAAFFFGGRVNYGVLRAQANRFASALQGMGFRKGERLGLLLPNMPQTIISAFGALKAGGVAVFFDPLQEEEELERQFNDAGVEILVILDLVLRRVDKIFPRTRLKQFIITGVKDYLPFPRDFLFSLAARGRGINVRVAKKPNIRLFKDFLFGAPPDASSMEASPNNDEEEAVILYTRGTSGPAKGVRLSHKNLVAALLQATAWIGEVEKGKEVFLSILPSHQTFGMTLAMNLPIYLAGMSIHLPQFEMGQVLSAVRKHRPSFFPASPSMIESLSTYPEIMKYKISSIKTCWSVGKELEKEDLQSFERKVGRKVSEAYGLTEASGLTHANPLYGKR